jgi:hypothetical protein
LNFSPSFVWLKARSINYVHGLHDVVRGGSRLLLSNSTTAELVDEQDGSISAFTSDGFTISAGSRSADTFNDENKTYVAWAWDAGTTTTTNTVGSISSQVRANASAGFSVVTWTDPNTSGTIGHGLGAPPELIIAKSRTVAYAWAVWHKAISRDGSLFLNSTAAYSYINSNYWGSSAPTSSVFGVGYTGESNNEGDMVAYCFAPVAGYSSFGSYTGNGSTDGPFVYTGFRPAFVLIKTSSTSGNNWYLYDYKREAEYNPTTKPLFPDGSFAEQGDSRPVDLLSNGFKIRYASFFNANGETMIYACFAESPFQYARAR